MKILHCFALGLFFVATFGGRLHGQNGTAKIGHGYEFEGNGKDRNAAALSRLYTKDSQAGMLISTLNSNDSTLLVSLKNQYRFLFLKDPDQRYKLQNLNPSNGQLRQTVQTLIDQLEKPGPSSAEKLTLYRLQGEDGRGNVHFTAYFTPVMEASPVRTDTHRYPIYKKPAGAASLPSRKAIDGQGALANKGLEVAWTASLLENYFLQVQGSGYMSFPDGSLQFMAYNGQNGLPYRSLGKYMISQGHISEADISLESIRQWFASHSDSLEHILYKNESYTFLAPVNDQPKGASGFPLSPEHSIAVDSRYIPLGAVLLAKVPVLDQSGKLTGHEFRILTAQDKGGAIQGPGHVDLYMGVGEDALKKASAMHHYGALWLILAE